MQFGSEAVRQVLALFEEEAPPMGDAVRLAELTGAWDELLAHLLMRRDSFRACPEIEAAIRTQAEAYRGRAATSRPGGDDLIRLEQTEAEVEAALVALLSADADRMAVADRVSAAWRGHAAERRPVGFDLNLRIGTERRS